MVTLEQIQQRLIETIQNCGMTQTELAKKLGISNQAIGQYLHQNRFPALDTLANLCNIVDVSPAYILFYEDEGGAR